ncbi:hypothetical protein N7456_001226 [Penicillium angulare]|uniref:Uncharacterized protein n=1 Tax=Penicillium angulare TaxID=116970 RepID=A0A9W9GDH7_9EURO|nr:hypothetical protein N7456_001226 [Penicillium angulare]
MSQGDSISENEPIQLDFYRAVWPGSSLVFHDKLMICIKDPRFKDPESVGKLCEVVSDLSKVPPALFEKRKNSSGQEYYRIWYKLVLTPCSASLLFDVEFNGMSYGTARANYY